MDNNIFNVVFTYYKILFEKIAYYTDFRDWAGPKCDIIIKLCTVEIEL